MSNKPFTHLHFHTAYSLLDGACKVKDVMQNAVKQGMDSVAITDHGVLYGAIDFYKTAKKAGIKPILGCEVYTAPEGTRMTERKTAEDGSYSNHLVLLAENEVGYKNLVKLVSRAHLEGFYYKPRIDKELLREFNEGIIGLSACLKGEVCETIVKKGVDAAYEKVEEFVDILGKDNFYLELMDHGIHEQRVANEGIIQIAKDTGLPLVCSNDVHYVQPEHYEAHDCMICLQTGTTMSDPKRMRYESEQFYMKSPTEMWELFKDHPEACMNTMEVAERCNVDLNLGKEFHFPLYDVPEPFDQRGYLIHLAKEGIRKLYGIDNVDNPANPDEERVKDRFYFELGVIEKTGFINYFLVVWDFIRYALDNKIPVGPGRGSGAGSIVAYLLGITGIDPLHYNLIFERFLNPERVSPPDFDIDFCQARRGEVIEYVKDKYGRDNVAQIITFGTLGAKTVIRDVGRVLDLEFNVCDRLAKMVPDDPGMTLEKAMAENPEFRQACETDPNAKQIMKYARVLEGLPRNPGTHAAGVVIGETVLENILPLSRDKDKEVVTQFEMKPMEETGLLKMDFLGLKTLTVIQEAVDNVERNHGVVLDMAKLSMNDPKTFELLNKGDTIGVFQVESPGMQDLLRRIQLTRFEDLIAMIALYRPGPMNMLDDFVNRKHGTVKIQYDHPLLETVLNETYGVMLYQEQVQMASNVLAGFSLGQGDLLRRAMGKKDQELMAEMKAKFVKGCKEKNKISEKLAAKIFENIEAFAGYGFNKSHSAAYAVLSIQTGYLKAHYPVEFVAASMSSEMGNAEKLPKFLNEAKEMDIPVLPPDVNESVVRFRPIDGKIRFGLAGIKGVGVGAVEALVEEREKNGPFESLVDYCCRVDSSLCNKKVLEALTMGGAFDFTGMDRGRLHSGVEFAMNRASETLRDRAAGQSLLFDMMGDSDTNDNENGGSKGEELPICKPWAPAKVLAEEKFLLGFYISGHPLKEYEWALTHFGLTDFKQLPDLEPNTQTRIGGLVVQCIKRFTKKTQEPMAIFRLEGLEGSVEAIAFPDCYREYGVHLAEDAPVIACGEIRHEEDRLKFHCMEVFPLADAHRHFSKKLGIHLPAANLNDEKLQTIRETLRRHPGETAVNIVLEFGGGEKVYINTARSYMVGPSHELIHELEKSLGEGSIYLAVNKNPFKKYTNDRGGKRWQKRGEPQGAR